MVVHINHVCATMFMYMVAHVFAHVSHVCTTMFTYMVTQIYRHGCTLLQCCRALSDKTYSMERDVAIMTWRIRIRELQSLSFSSVITPAVVQYEPCLLTKAPSSQSFPHTGNCIPSTHLAFLVMKPEVLYPSSHGTSSSVWP